MLQYVSVPCYEESLNNKMMFRTHVNALQKMAIAVDRLQFFLPHDDMSVT